jgi:mono/diheme cytochrome c family protein
MKTRITVLLIALALAAIFVSGCGNISLAADVTPPPDYTPPTVQPTLDVTGILPTEPPDPALGKVVYAEKCAACHGVLGMGDGPQAGSLQITVPAIGSASETQSSLPLDWFMLVTNGRMDRFMPGFKSLNDKQKWDVLAYVYSMNVTPEVLEQGKTVYQAECQSCHGENGKGDGPAAASLDTKPADWKNPGKLLGMSLQNMMDITTAGKGTAMPAFAAKLDEDQRWAVLSYIRQMNFAKSGAESAQVTETQSAAIVQSETPVPAENTSQTPSAASTEVKLTTATITGKVINGSGSAVPADLKVTLVGYDSMQPGLSLETELQADDSFKWENVELADSRVFIVNVVYNGITFQSQVLHAADFKPGETISAPVTIYETSTDASGINADRMHVFFEFPAADRVQIIEMFLISNPSNRMIIPAGENKPVLEFKLPKGAENLQFQDGQLGDRYLQTADGFGDTASILPGNAKHQVLFAFDLPYEKSANIPLALPMNVTNAVIMVPQDGVSLEGEKLQDAGQRTMQQGALHLFTASGLTAGSNLDIKLTGRPGMTPMVSTGSTSGLLISGGVLLAALIAAGYWFFSRKSAGKDEPEVSDGEEESVESLLDAIVALDDLFQAGKLAKPAYLERREELKSRLKAARGE